MNRAIRLGFAKTARRGLIFDHAFRRGTLCRLLAWTRHGASICHRTAMDQTRIRLDLAVRLETLRVATK